ncbi:alpha/beta hydrolase [Rhodocyclus tenuis]|uniref:Alpha/beta fold hydrolase n=2 Tax=Rhodocyclus TaxID=1064 RepID=A0A6L5JTS0_RHOTE|nr:alpha/beta hydrolase [Rhodocyclus gracilis]MQY50793.1 alpha/beta fold hydrolase [Rhodocyclus gracilis]NJA87641.1 alpha/beta hydrolase [Rhodocyclus gracilis]
MNLLIANQTAYAYTGGVAAVATDADSARPAVVFIHGAGQDHSGWTLQSRWFAHHGFRVLVPDLPGHGRSAGTPLASIEEAADWIVALLDAANIQRAALVGHSMGSLIALDVAARAAPSRVSHLALLGCSVPMPVADGLLAAARDDEATAWQMINDWSHSPRGLLGGNTVPGVWLLGSNRQLMARQRPGVLLAGLDACRRYAPDAAALAQIDAAIHIVAGSADRMTPLRATLALQSLLPTAGLSTIAGAGHSLMAEAPDAVLDSLRGFLLP